MRYRTRRCPNAVFARTTARASGSRRTGPTSIPFDAGVPARRAPGGGSGFSTFRAIAHGAGLSLAAELDIYADHERHHLQPAFFLLDPERRIRHVSVQSGGMARPPVEEFVALVSAASRPRAA